MSEPKILIDCRDAALGYEGRPIWEHLSFRVRRGDYLCIVGDNGSGKSTLLKSLLGLLRPLSGEIHLDDSVRRGAIGYLPQQTRAQKDFPATVSEVVLSGFLSARGWKFFYTPAQKSQALQHMGKLGILELKDRCYRELSGGQQQRVLLARALCAAGDLLVLDEPRCRRRPVPHPAVSQPHRGHGRGDGDPRHPQRPAGRHRHPARRTEPVVPGHAPGISGLALRKTLRR